MRNGRASPPGRDLILREARVGAKARDQIELATNMAEPTTRGVTRNRADTAVSKRAKKERIIFSVSLVLGWRLSGRGEIRSS